jgi:hypothetical protein
MLRLLKEIYLTAFVVLSRIGAWAPRTNAAISAGAITVIEICLLIGVVGWVEMVIAGPKSSLHIPRLEAFVASVGLYAANYYPLIICGYGTTFEREFTSLKRSRRVFLVASSVVMMLAAIAFFIFSAVVHRHALGVDKQ